jgi:hypothetical protein
MNKQEINFKKVVEILGPDDAAELYDSLKKQGYHEGVKHAEMSPATRAAIFKRDMVLWGIALIGGVKIAADKGIMLAPVKIATVKNFLYTFAVWIGLQWDTMGILIAFMILDTMLGVGKAIALGEKPTSRRLGFGVASKLILLIIPIVLIMMGKSVSSITGADMDFAGLAHGAIAIMVMSEGYSILGNIYAIKTKKPVEEYDAVSIMLGAIREKLLRVLQK